MVDTNVYIMRKYGGSRNNASSGPGLQRGPAMPERNLPCGNMKIAMSMRVTQSRYM